MPSKIVTLRNGIRCPTLGQGTWFMGESSSAKKEEIAALQRGIDLGMTLIDTAEMYASGGAEKVTGEAIAGRRDKVFLISKVLPGNASRRGTIAAFERSLDRLKTDYLDLYLLHWRGGYSLEETFDAMERLLEAGNHPGLWRFQLRSGRYGRSIASRQRPHLCQSGIVQPGFPRHRMGLDALAERTPYSCHGLFTALSDTSVAKRELEAGRRGIVDHTGPAGVGLVVAPGRGTDSEVVQCQACRGKPESVGHYPGTSRAG